MILGITGAIGSGKSLVTQSFSRRQWYVFSADECCRLLWQSPDAAMLEKVRKHFGEALFNEARKLDRQKIADAVFGDPEKMKTWLALLYPALKKTIDAEIARCRAEKRNGAFEVPLLFENHYETEFDAILAVWSGKTLRHARLRQYRQLDEAEIVRREALQMAEDQKLELADFAVVNTADEAWVECQLDELEKIINQH